MKKLNTLIILLAMTVIAYGQDFTLAHSTGKLIVEEVDELTIEGYNGTEIIFSGDRDGEVNERAAGLKLINSLGIDDNTGLGINVKEEGNDVHVTGLGNANDGRVTIKLPQNMDVYYSHSDYKGGELIIQNIAGEIEVSAAYNDVHLINVTGPMAVKSIYGEIEAVFSTLSQEGSISLNSSYNLIDVTLPSSAGINLNMSTPYGNIYSDVDVNIEAGDDDMRRISTKKVKGTVNGGGVEVTIKSGYEDIYLRKG